MQKPAFFDELTKPDFEIRLSGQNLRVISEVALKLNEEESQAIRTELVEFVIKALSNQSKKNL